MDTYATAGPGMSRNGRTDLGQQDAFRRFADGCSQFFPRVHHFLEIVRVSQPYIAVSIILFVGLLRPGDEVGEGLLFAAVPFHRLQAGIPELDDRPVIEHVAEKRLECIDPVAFFKPHEVVQRKTEKAHLPEGCELILQLSRRHSLVEQAHGFFPHEPETDADAAEIKDMQPARIIFSHELPLGPRAFVISGQFPANMKRNGFIMLFQQLIVEICALIGVKRRGGDLLFFLRVAVCTAGANQNDPALSGDGAIITWQDYRGSETDIYAQRINAAGIPQWSTDGVVLCSADDYQYYPQIVGDGDGGAIITWEDNRNGGYSSDDYDIYAQRVFPNGAITMPTVSFASDGQSIFESTWSTEIPASLSEVFALDVTVPFTISGTATEGGGEDYTLTSSPLLIPVGSIDGSITLLVNEDAFTEPDETVVITLGTPTNATLGATTVYTATILDNEPRADISVGETVDKKRVEVQGCGR